MKTKEQIENKISELIDIKRSFVLAWKAAKSSSVKSHLEESICNCDEQISLLGWVLE